MENSLVSFHVDGFRPMKRKKTARVDLGGGSRGAHPPEMTCGFVIIYDWYSVKYADMYDLYSQQLATMLLLFFVCFCLISWFVFFQIKPYLLLTLLF